MSLMWRACAANAANLSSTTTSASIQRLSFRASELRQIISANLLSFSSNCSHLCLTHARSFQALTQALMASLPIAFSPAAGRVFAATASKGAGGSKEEKSILDWILGGLQKEDQLLETDPILKKVEEKNGGTTSAGRKNSVAVPQKKNGGFGGLFAKKE